jgi:F-type H+-transporting ATPase subunit b
MPAFLEAAFWNFSNPEFWVGVGLLIFFAIVVAAGAPKMIAANLDSQSAKIKADLEEADRIRKEAEAMLASIKLQREQTEKQAVEMLAAAKADAARMALEAKAKLEDQIVRRAALAERNIASAEASAMAEVKAAAVDMASAAAEKVLAARLSGGGSDKLVDAAITTIGTRLQ